jgi:SAM-dependent methyltransferase
MTTIANTAQAEYWNAEVGKTWAAEQDLLDEQLRPLGELAMEALAPQAGERVLDIGCGCGDTSLALAARVGPDGQVVGVDISEPMLARAEDRAKDVSRVRFLHADAQAHAFEGAGFDALFSRFGVMFFADPGAAFSNLISALKPHGRIAFVCWRTPPESPLMTVPSLAVADILPPSPPADPHAPGPFAFADAERLRSLMQRAGFEAVTITAHDLPVGVSTLEGQVELGLRIGPLGSAIRQNPALADQVKGRVREAISAFMTPEGPRMTAGVWIVTAVRPAS